MTNTNSNHMQKALIRLRLASIIQWFTQIIQSILLIYLVHQMASYTIETSLKEAAYFLANTTMIFVVVHLARRLIRQILKIISNPNIRNFRFFDRVEKENMRKAGGFSYLYDQARYTSIPRILRNAIYSFLFNLLNPSFTLCHLWRSNGRERQNLQISHLLI